MERGERRSRVSSIVRVKIKGQTTLWSWVVGVGEGGGYKGLERERREMRGEGRLYWLTVRYEYGHLHGRDRGEP